MRSVIITILLTLTLWSCGARKTQVQVSESEAKTELQEETKAVIDTKSQSNTVTEVTEENAVYTPIDNSKPIVIEFPSGKKTTVWNAKYETGNRQSKSETSEAAETRSVTENKSNAVHVAKQSEKQKATDRKDVFPWWWLLLLIPVGYIWYKRKNYFS